MVYVNIDKDKLLESIGDVAGINKNLISNQNDFDAITKSLDSDIKDMAQINENITKISNEMFVNIDDLSKLFIFLQYAHSEYSKLDYIDSDILISESTKDNSNYWNSLFEVLGLLSGFTTIGSASKISSSILDYILSSEHFELELGGYILDFIDNGFTEFFGSNATVSGTVTAGNIIFTALDSIYSNLEEFGNSDDMTLSRLFGEIIGETGVSVAAGMACTAIAGAFFSGPIAIGAVAICLGFVLNSAGDYIFNKITGENLVESVSDFILDFGDVVVSTSNQITSTIADVIVDTVNIVTDVVGDVVDYGKNLLDDVGDAIQALNPFTKWSFG